MRTKLIIPGMIVLHGLAACVTYRPDDLGTQTGYVQKIYPSTETPTDHPECLVSLTDDQRSSGRYVEVQFKHLRSKRYVNIFVGNEIELKLSDQLLVASPYCIGNHKPRIIAKQN